MEIWKDIDGADGYQVSNEGNVKSLEKFKQGCDLPHWSHTKEVRLTKIKNKERLLTPAVDGYGFNHVRLKLKDGSIKLYKVHRLVAKAFLADYNEESIVIHKDGNYFNNAVSNLEMRPKVKADEIKSNGIGHLYKCVQTNEEFCSFKAFAKRNNLPFSKSIFLKSVAKQISYADSGLNFIKIR